MGSGVTSATILSTYAIGLGSNRALARGMPPPAMLRAALAALGEAGVVTVALSPIIASAPLGPSRRRFANAVALVETQIEPPALLALLKATERRLGRTRGQRWGARRLDLDILLWSGGRWNAGRGSKGRALTVPHAQYRARDFVLGPLCAVAPGWRDPVTGLTPRHLAARLAKAKGRSKAG